MSWAGISGALPKFSHLVPSGHTGPTSTISPYIFLLRCFLFPLMYTLLGQARVLCPCLPQQLSIRAWQEMVYKYRKFLFLGKTTLRCEIYTEFPKKDSAPVTHL